MNMETNKQTTSNEREIEPVPSADSNTLSGATSIFALAVCVVVCFSASAVGSFLAFDSVGTWYREIEKPFWTPPSWVFGPVWTALYLMMALAAWRIWRRYGLRNARISLGMFALQLIFNALWTPLFFGLHSPSLAFIDIIILWVLIIATTILFSKRDRIATILMIPYLLWTSFALALNGAIAWMNR